jgi:hypothetical protein
MLEATLTGASYVAGVANKTDGAIIANGTPALIDAIMSACEQDKRLREMLYGMTQTSAYMNIAIAASAIVIPILINHNLIPNVLLPTPKAETNGQYVHQPTK